MEDSISWGEGVGKMRAPRERPSEAPITVQRKAITRVPKIPGVWGTGETVVSYCSGSGGAMESRYCYTIKGSWIPICILE